MRRLVQLRQYEEHELGADGYPHAWHKETIFTESDGLIVHDPAIKDYIRWQAGFRCVRCKHPYEKGDPRISERGEWSPCDDKCEAHGGGTRWRFADTDTWLDGSPTSYKRLHTSVPMIVEAQWRILTVHHLDEDKANCRWFNLAALCQRCHLRMQRAVVMDRPWHFEHSEWFRPYAAGFYGWKYLKEDLTSVEVYARMDELLALEHRFDREALF